MNKVIEELGIYWIIKAAPFALAVTLLYAAARLIYLKAKQRRHVSISEEIARCMLAWYLATLLVIVWLPYLPDFINGTLTWAEFAERIFDKGEFTCNDRFLHLFQGDFSVLTDAELLSNIALFVPYTALLVVGFRRLKWWVIDLIALGTTILIELVQPFLGRSCDVDDIIANTLGGVLGCLIAKLVIALIENNRHSRKT